MSSEATSYTLECKVVVLDGHAAPNVPRYHFPPDAKHGQDGVIVRVDPLVGDPWLAMFAFGDQTRAPVRLLAMPNPRRFCVVARGAGYIASTRSPSWWEPVAAVPIMDVIAAPEAGLVLFSCFTGVVAHDLDGERWRTGRISWDGLKLLSVEGTSLVGQYFDIRSDADTRFEIDLLTGEVRGGIEQP